jgi:hypothetical protein
LSAFIFHGSQREAKIPFFQNGRLRAVISGTLDQEPFGSSAGRAAERREVRTILYRLQQGDRRLRFWKAGVRIGSGAPLNSIAWAAHQKRTKVKLTADSPTTCAIA